jgi:hypothetical protein
VRRYLTKITGLRRAQMTRLIECWTRRKRRMIERAARRRFACRYTDEDIVLLAAVDTTMELPYRPVSAVAPIAALSAGMAPSVLRPN